MEVLSGELYFCWKDKVYFIVYTQKIKQRANETIINLEKTQTVYIRE